MVIHQVLNESRRCFYVILILVKVNRLFPTGFVKLITFSEDLLKILLPDPSRSFWGDIRARRHVNVRGWQVCAQAGAGQQHHGARLRSFCLPWAEGLCYPKEESWCAAANHTG